MCWCPYLLVPEVLLLCYWIRLKILALTLLESKKKLNLNIVKTVSMGSHMSIPFLASVLSLLFDLSISFWAYIRVTCYDEYEEIISLSKSSILGLPKEQLEHLVLHCIPFYAKEFILILRVYIPNHWFASSLCLLIYYCFCLCILKYWSVQHFLWAISYMLPACHKCALISK